MEKLTKRFGDFIKEKRKKAGRTLKDMSEILEISLSLLSDIESNRRKPFDGKNLEKFAKELNLSNEERNELYDLAGRDNREVPADIEEVFMYSDIGDMARLALRKSLTGEIDEEDWKELIRQKEKRKQDQGEMP